MALSDQYLLHLQLTDTISGKLRGISRTGQQLTEQLTGGQRRVQQSFRQTAVSAGRLQGSLTGLHTALSSLGLISGIAGAALAVKELVSTGASFESQMSKVEALTGATTEEFERLTATARKLGQTTTFSARQVAEAEGFAAMAGYTADQINVALPAVLNLAKATGTDLAFAMDAATNIAAQFGFEAAELPRVVDRVAAVTASANTNFQQLAEGMKFIGPTAKALGIDIEEAAAVVGKLASAGLQSSLGTRALSTSLVNLTKSTPRQQKILDAYGLNFFEDGNFVGIIGAIEELEQKLRGVTQKKRASLIMYPCKSKDKRLGRCLCRRLFLCAEGIRSQVACHSVRDEAPLRSTGRRTTIKSCCRASLLARIRRSLRPTSLRSCRRTSQPCS